MYIDTHLCMSAQLPDCWHQKKCVCQRDMLMWTSVRVCLCVMHAAWFQAQLHMNVYRSMNKYCLPLQYTHA